MKKILSLLLILSAAGMFFSCKPDKNEKQPVPAKVSVTGVSLSTPSIELQPGGTFQLSALIQPDNATDKTVEWSSSNTSVATVDQTGKVTAVGAGSATITAKTKDGGKVATASVTVKAGTVAVTGVTLDKNKLNLEPGETAVLTATVAPEDATDKTVEWSSSDKKVATVDDKGVVTAVGAGTATITATTKDGGKTAKATVTVKAGTVAVTGVTLDKEEAAIAVGETLQLTATVQPENAANKAVTWNSSSTGVATVDANGLVTAKKTGTAIITVHTKDGNKTASCKVTVRTPAVAVTGVTLDQEEATLPVGETLQLTATVQPEDATDKTVTWQSSNTGVATVDANGKVTAKKTGSTTITVTTKDGAKTATCKITVVAATVHVTGVTVNKTAVGLSVSESLQLTASVQPSNASDKTVAWSSSNESVATVDANGKVTAKKAGTATITATTKDGGKTATCKVTVTDKTQYSIRYNGEKILSLTYSIGVNPDDYLPFRLYDENSGSYLNPKDVSVTTSKSSVASLISRTASQLNVFAKAAGTTTLTFSLDGKVIAIVDVTVNAAAVTYVVYYGDSEIPSEITHKLGSTENDCITLRLYNKTTKEFVNPKYLIVSVNPTEVIDRGGYLGTEYHLYAKKVGTAVVSFRVGAQTLKSVTIHVTGSGS